MIPAERVGKFIVHVWEWCFVYQNVEEQQMFEDN